MTLISFFFVRFLSTSLRIKLALIFWIQVQTWVPTALTRAAKFLTSVLSIKVFSCIYPFHSPPRHNSSERWQPNNLLSLQSVTASSALNLPAPNLRRRVVASWYVRGSTHLATSPHPGQLPHTRFTGTEEFLSTQGDQLIYCCVCGLCQY